MAGTHLIGIDIGTTGAKAIIFTDKGEIRASGYYEYTCTYPRPGWVEQDVDMIVEKSMEAASDAVGKAGIAPEEVAAVAFSTQRCCTIFLDSDGKLIRPMISWQDNRPVQELETIKDKLAPEEFYQITSMPLNTTWMISKILWFRKHEPENWKRCSKIVQLQDYALKYWGADDYYDDYSDAGFYGLWDPFAMEWNEKILDLFEIPQKLLPKTVASGTVVGTISKQAAEKTGLSPKTPLVVGAGDQNSAALGAGITAPGLLSVSLGTGGLAAAYIDEPFRDSGCMTMVTNHAIPGAWQLEGLQAGAASVYRWFRDEIALTELEEAKKTGRDVYELLNEMVAKVPPGAKGLAVLPYFASATTPRWNPDARGVIAGLSFAHDRNCLARAFMEGITMEVNDMLSSLTGSGVKVEEVHILGGPTKSPIWNQMQADMYNRTVKTVKTTDAAPLGAAICGGAGVGLFHDIPSGAERMVEVDQTYEPDPERAELYRELYGIFCRLYEGMTEKGGFEALSRFQEKYFD